MNSFIFQRLVVSVNRTAEAAVTTPVSTITGSVADKISRICPVPVPEIISISWPTKRYELSPASVKVLAEASSTFPKYPRSGEKDILDVVTGAIGGDANLM